MDLLGGNKIYARKGPQEVGVREEKGKREDEKRSESGRPEPGIGLKSSLPWDFLGSCDNSQTHSPQGHSIHLLTTLRRVLPPNDHCWEL